LDKTKDSGNSSEQKDKGDKEEQAASSGKEEPYAVDISALDTYTTLKLFLNILAGQATMKMGLIVDPHTNKIEKDINQARIAIDCFQFISKQLEAHLSEDEKKKLSSMLSDLQINFVTHK
jgi:hypothetical protein